MTINRETEYRKLSEEYLRLLLSLQNVFIPTGSTTSPATWKKAIDLIEEHAKSAYLRVEREIDRIKKGLEHQPGLLKRYMRESPNIVSIDTDHYDEEAEDLIMRVEYRDGSVATVHARTLTAHMEAFLGRER